MNIQPSNLSQPAMSERKVGLLGAAIVLLGPLSMSLFSPAMPELARAFGSTEAAVKMTLSFYFAGFALSQLICGPLSDGLGRKPVTLVFLIIYVVASLLALFSPTIEILIAARFVQGAGAAVGVAVSRAIVRDLYTGETSSRIMNMIGMILGIGPALAPTLGGLTMELFGWQAIFVLMLGLGIVVAVIVKLTMVETVVRDPSRIKPGAVLHSYKALMTNSYFMVSGVVIASTIGVFYTLATILPFVLMNDVGLTPTQFGLGMLVQSLSFFMGTVVVRKLMERYGAFKIQPVGFLFIIIGSVSLAVVLQVYEPSFILVMAPISLYVFGSTFVMPAMFTASVAPFPHMAGAAAAVSGFIQMGGGLVGSLVASLFSSPVIALGTVVPIMGMIATVSWIFWRRMPEPVLAKILPSEKLPPSIG